MSGQRSNERDGLVFELERELSDLARAACRPGSEDTFSAEYGRLLSRLQAGLRAMRQLAVTQGSYLQQQAEKSARAN